MRALSPRMERNSLITPAFMCVPFVCPNKKSGLTPAVSSRHSPLYTIAYCVSRLLNEGQAMWYQAREHVCVQHYDNPHDRGQRDRVPEDKPENLAFIAQLVGGGGGDNDGLCVHHFAHHTASAVGRAHQDGIEVELLGRDLLQAPEQCVRRS